MTQRENLSQTLELEQGFHKIELMLYSAGTDDNQEQEEDSVAKAIISKVQISGTQDGGAYECKKCPNGFISKGGSSTCTPCPTGQ